MPIKDKVTLYVFSSSRDFQDLVWKDKTSVLKATKVSTTNKKIIFELDLQNSKSKQSEWIYMVWSLHFENLRVFFFQANT